MHLYIAVRGIWDEVHRFVNDILAVYLPYKYHKDEKPGILQCALRPIWLFEIAFPEEELQRVYDIVKPDQSDIKGVGAAMLRKIVKAEKVPDKIRKNYKPTPFPPKRSIAVTAIGIKKDKRDKDGIELI